jgi:signal transduction histidine kinase
MRATGFGRLSPLEVGWVAFALANLAAMAFWPSWETIPFHFIWVSLTLLYGFRIWGLEVTGFVLALVAVSTGFLITSDAYNGEQLWGELFEVPLMSAMFLAMVWHARRRQDALKKVKRQADERAAMLQQQESFLHDVSHELRTPATIARGHLEVLRQNGHGPLHEVDVALDELGRIERILQQLLLRKTDHPDFIVLGEIDLEAMSKTSSCAGRRLLRAGGDSARCRQGDCALIRRRSGSHSTPCSRTPCTTPMSRMRSSCEPG